MSTKPALHKKVKVVALTDLVGVPEGTTGKVVLVNGISWIRYWVRFDNGVTMGSINRTALATPDEWEHHVNGTTAGATSGGGRGGRGRRRRRRRRGRRPDDVERHARAGPAARAHSGRSGPPRRLETRGADGTAVIESALRPRASDFGERAASVVGLPCVGAASLAVRPRLLPGGLAGCARSAVRGSARPWRAGMP